MGYAAEVFVDDPVGFWRLAEGSGLPQDISGFGNHADEVIGSPTYAQTGPVTSDPGAGAINFTGSQYFGVPDAVSLDLGQVFSLEGWLKRNTSSGGMAIVVKYGGYGLFIDSGNHLMLGYSNVAGLVSSTTTITDTTTWHHLVATKNGTISKLYIDAVDRTGTVTDATIPDNANKLYLGSESSAELVNGLMAELAIYNVALSPARVTAHFNAATGAATSRYQDLMTLGAG